MLCDQGGGGVPAAFNELGAPAPSSRLRKCVTDAWPHSIRTNAKAVPAHAAVVVRIASALTRDIRGHRCGWG
jgi:hypothetical protein